MSGGTITVTDIGSDVAPYKGKGICVVCGERKARVFWRDMDGYMECKRCYGIFRYFLLRIKKWANNT